MTPERHQRISDLFARLCEVKPDERSAVLHAECGDDRTLAEEVAALLRRDADPAPFLDRPATEPGLALLAPAADAALGPPEPLAPHARFGAYSTVRVIAAGGMGVVYEAVQDRPRRTVALKVMRRGLGSPAALRRFELEAELLGRLDHPGIARVYEAGALRDTSMRGGGEEVPFFAMEFVQGRPLTAFARERRLPRPECLALFARVCDAVHHAHQRGVIHRDLKPANILITDAGHPKILDFGVARATDLEGLSGSPRTDAGELLGTIPYMSPEQLDGDPREVDIRADVYALGVILYELLAGRRPLALDGKSVPEAIRTARDAVPPPVDSIDRALRGDLSTIAGKAIEKDRERRYQSAADLAADVRRHIAGEPITARPHGTMHQFVRLARRHKAGVAAAVVVAVTLMVGSLVSTGLAVEATRARARSDAALRDALATSGFLLDVFLGSPDQPTVNRIALIEKAELMLNTQGVSDPRLEAKVREFIGHGWLKLNYAPRAEPHLIRALDIRRSLGRADDDMVKGLHLLAMLRFAQGRADDGRVLLREALARRRTLHGPHHLTTHPDDEILFYARVYTPDEPDATADDTRRRTMRELPPDPTAGPPSEMPQLFRDDFEGDGIDPAWTTTLDGARGWASTIAGSRLTVSGIEPLSAPGQSPPPAKVRLARALPPAGDFHATARVGWDSRGRPDAIQSIAISLVGPGRRLIASAGAADFFLQWEGGRSGRVGAAGEVGRDVVHAHSGYDTLPASGEAEVVIARAGDRVTVWWDGRELLTGFAADPAIAVELWLVFTPFRQPAGEASFGTLWVDRVVLRARPHAGDDSARRP